MRVVVVSVIEASNRRPKTISALRPPLQPAVRGLTAKRLPAAALTTEPAREHVSPHLVRSGWQRASASGLAWYTGQEILSTV
jgi:hypothetical protein